MLGTVSWKEMLVILLIIFFGIPLAGELVDLFTPEKVKKERERKRNTKAAKWKAKQERKIRIAMLIVFGIILTVYTAASYLKGSM